MIAQHTERLSKFAIVGDANTGFTVSPQVFTTVEAKAGDITETADALALVGRSMRLGSVFDHAQSMRLREIHHGLHLYRVAIQVNGDDNPRALGQSRFQLSPVHGIGFRVNIYEYRSGSYQRNRFHRR